MPFKVHLVIVSFIILTVYLAWQVINTAPPTQVETATEPASPYKIIIAHASWGLNCRRAGSAALPKSDGFAVDTSNTTALTEDNVLKKISEYCNNKVQCTVAVNTQTLGPDPEPNCLEKELLVEYRCFSYDRPWIAKSTRSIDINCDQPNK